jgi:nucleoid-associated protein YgaU
MGLFGKSFEEKVNEALARLRPQFPGANIKANIQDEVVTLVGEVADLATKSKIMAAFDELVKTKNTINQITIAKPVGPPAPPAAAPGPIGARIHEVVKGDTLGAIAKTYYGNASLYPKIFEANRDILDNPDLIKVGQKLKIPE